MRKFTYGYIREATLAHLDLDDDEAQNMGLFNKFPFYANEAMNAICATKPRYDYVDVQVVKQFEPLVVDGSNFVLATAEQIRILENWLSIPVGMRPSKDTLPVKFVESPNLEKYWHEQGTYEVREKIDMGMDFIAFAPNKKCFKYVPDPMFQGFCCGLDKRLAYDKIEAEEGLDFTYIGKQRLKFYKAGHYLIPARFFWHVFTQDTKDEDELDMPADILNCIPLYIAAVCLQSENLTKAQMKRQEFELALSRCTATDVLENRDIKSTW